MSVPLMYNFVYWTCFLKEILQETVTRRQQVEFERRKLEKEERINRIIQARKQGRETKRKNIFFVLTEQERINKLREEEEAREREGIHIYI